MIATFTIDGQPQGKGRPIYSGKNHTMRTPDKTVIYENLIKLAYGQQCKGVFFDKGVPLFVSIDAYFKMPKASKNKTAQMLSGEIKAITKPDLDNIAKAIADSLNGVAYHDDSQIVFMSVGKLYGEKPCVRVKIGDRLSEMISDIEEVR